MMSANRTPVKQKAKQLAKILRQENPDYDYLSKLFKHLRKELGIEITHKDKKPPYVPTEKEIRKYYDTVCKSHNMIHVILIKTLLYTGARVSELVKIKLSEIDLNRCQIRIIQNKGKKDRLVPFPASFKEILVTHVHNTRENGGKYLFVSSHKKPYTDRGIRKILERYSKEAGMKHPISPHKLRHFLFTWLKKQGEEYANIIDKFPV
jgi:integrase/recombinase XerD